MRDAVVGSRRRWRLLSFGDSLASRKTASAAIMGVIASGCALLSVQIPTQDIIIGVIIFAAVTLDHFRQRRLAASQYPVRGTALPDRVAVVRR